MDPKRARHRTNGDPFFQLPPLPSPSCAPPLRGAPKTWPSLWRFLCVRRGALRAGNSGPVVWGANEATMHRVQQITGQLAPTDAAAAAAAATQQVSSAVPLPHAHCPLCRSLAQTHAQCGCMHTQIGMLGITMISSVRSSLFASLLVLCPLLCVRWHSSRVCLLCARLLHRLCPAIGVVGRCVCSVRDDSGDAAGHVEPRAMEWMVRAPFGDMSACAEQRSKQPRLERTLTRCLLHSLLDVHSS